MQIVDSKPYSSASVTSGGSGSATGGTLYTGKTSDPMVVVFLAPIATPTPSPTPTPLPSGLVAYDPPAGTFSLFPASIFNQPVQPTPDPSSSAYVAALGTMSFGSLQFAANPSGLSQDYQYPIYYDVAPSTPGALTYTIHCTESWGTCPVEGKVVHLIAGEIPENYQAPGTSCSGDCHMAIEEPSGYEFDFWGTKWPPSGGTLDISWGGQCDALTGDGYDGCYATATGTPLSIGIIRVSDLMRAIQTGGVLPYALQVAVKCSNGFIPPMEGGDNTCAGGPPEGKRFYIALHDADINALPISNIAKAIERTLDEDHFGGIISDTNGGQSGFSLQEESDLTYTALGLPGPWVTQFIPEAQAEGLSADLGLANNVYHVSIDYGAGLQHIVFAASNE